MDQIFLLSPASLSGERARILLRREARFDLARRIRSRPGAPLGEVMSFLSGLYFRGKLAYARAFAAPPAGTAGVLVIVPGGGLQVAERPVRVSTLLAMARVDVHPGNLRYRRPLVRDLTRLASAAGADCRFILLGSVATGKYLDLLDPILGERLLFPEGFAGRGDMSRGALLLRSARAGEEMAYVMARGAARHGPRPPRLGPLERGWTLEGN